MHARGVTLDNTKLRVQGLLLVLGLHSLVTTTESLLTTDTQLLASSQQQLACHAALVFIQGQD